MVRKVCKRYVSSSRRPAVKDKVTTFSSFSEIQQHLMENCDAVFVIDCPCGCGMLNCSHLKARPDGILSVLQVVNSDFDFNLSLRVIN